MRARHLAVVLLMLLSACYFVSPWDPEYSSHGESSWIVRVETDAEYQGRVGLREVSGWATTSYPIRPGECYMIQKTRWAGMIRVFITRRDYYGDSRQPKYHDEATTLPWAVIRGCL